MKEKLALIFVLYALTFTSSNCIKIADNENATTLNPLSSELKSENMSSEAQVTEKELEDDPKESITTPSYVYKIPPTLHNAKKLEKMSEKVLSDHKESINPTPASIHNHQQLIPEGKFKQAIINSKQQSFKNLIEKSNKLKDQVHLEAHPVEVKSQEDEIPPSAAAPTTKEFVPSPELNINFSSDHRHPSHFHPMNQYFRPPQHDAQFPQENHFTVQNPIIDTKWLGSSRSPMPDHLRPPEMRPQYHAPPQHGVRNTNVEFHHVTFPSHQQHYQHQQRPFSYPIQHGEQQQLTGERMVFPTDSGSLNQEEMMRQVPVLHQKASAINVQERAKGTWKWIPDSDEELQSYSPYTKFAQYDFQQHQTSHDRPYSFESSDVFSQQTTPPTGPSGVSSWQSGSIETEEINTGRPSVEAEKGDYKILRAPSPWKRIVHVMTAAIPIGLLISALTPRIVYVHPNASAPTIPPNFIQQQPPPNVNNLPPPSNAPNPLRQRAVFNYDAEIAQFLKIMDAQYREKHRGVHLEGMCEDQFFCEVALMGARHGASRMHRTLYQVALETPKAQAEKSGLSEIFSAIQRQNCNIFRCKKA